MSIANVLGVCTRAGIKLSTEGEELKVVAAKDAVTSEIIELLRTNKSALVKHLNEYSADKKFVLPQINKRKESELVPLSYAQQRLWFIDQMGEGSPQYNSIGYIEINDSLNLPAVEKAIARIIERHEILRTRYPSKDGEPYQLIEKEGHIVISKHDCLKLGSDESHKKIQEIAEFEARTAFDLSQDLLLRINLVRQAPDRTTLLYTSHHIASDGWSKKVFEDEFYSLYESFSKGQTDSLSQLSIQYADYALWQRDWLQGEMLEAQLDYWRKQLNGIPQIHSLPLDKPRPANQSFDGKCYIQLLDKNLTSRIREVCQQTGATLFMFMQTAFALLLGRYSNQTDIVMGIATEGRTHKDVESLIGFFINSLVLRTDLSGNLSFEQLLKRNQKQILDAYAHQDVPFEMLVEEMCPERDLSHNPLFQIMFAVERSDNSGQQGLEYEELARELQESHLRNSTTRSDLQVLVSDFGDVFPIMWNYNDSLFEEETLNRLSESYVALLESIVSEFDRNGEATQQDKTKADELNLLSPSQLRNQLVEWQGSDSAYPDNQLLHQLFEVQAEQSPDAIAVRFGGDTISYQALNAQANQLAGYLVAQGVGPNSRVALCVERSIAMMVGILGVLKAGGGYVPLDPALPAERLNWTLDDCQVEVVLTQQELMTELNFGERKLLPLDDDFRELMLGSFSTANLSSECAVTANDLAYVIYTSGSTGQPKGVSVSHRAAMSYCDYALGSYYTADLNGALIVTGYNVDMTVPGLYLPLLSGGCVQLLNAGLVLDELAKVLSQSTERFLIRLTPSHVIGLLSLLVDIQPLNNQHVFVIGGEMLHSSTVVQLKELFPHAKIMNHYGPTEAVVGCVLNTNVIPTESVDKVNRIDTGSIPIGRPMDNVQVYVLDEQQQLQIPGSIGELVVGGNGLADGYLNDVPLTEAKFIPNPFVADSQARLYRTGDWVRWLPDGNLDFIGRIDEQVKIRGFRIELGDIESALKAIETIKDVSVVVSTVVEGQPSIVAYVVPEAPIEGDDDLAVQQAKSECIKHYREVLGDSLPDYMVPSVYVFLDKLPITANGKVAKRELPEPQESDLQSEVYEAPRNETEQILCELWQTVLKLSQVGISDNFFTLGGHSLLATRLISAVRQQFDVELPLRMLFEFPTVAELADLIETQILEKNNSNRLQRLSLNDKELVSSDEEIEEGVL